MVGNVLGRIRCLRGAAVFFRAGHALTQLNSPGFQQLAVLLEFFFFHSGPASQFWHDCKPNMIFRKSPDGQCWVIQQPGSRSLAATGTYPATGRLALQQEVRREKTK